MNEDSTYLSPSIQDSMRPRWRCLARDRVCFLTGDFPDCFRFHVWWGDWQTNPRLLCLWDCQVQTHILWELVWEDAPKGLPTWVEELFHGSGKTHGKVLSGCADASWSIGAARSYQLTNETHIPRKWIHQDRQINSGMLLASLHTLFWMFSYLWYKKKKKSSWGQAAYLQGRHLVTSFLLRWLYLWIVQ